MQSSTGFSEPLGPVFVQQAPMARCVLDQLHFQIIRYFQTSLQSLQRLQGLDSKTGVDSEKTSAAAADQELARRMEGLGFQVGHRLVERSTLDLPLFTRPLDIIKYICKDFWLTVFGHQVDKLQTNHKGVWVLHDFKFHWLSRWSIGLPKSLEPGGNQSNPSSTPTKADMDPDRQFFLESLEPYLAFPRGLLRGALSCLGMRTSVQSDISNFPACRFTVLDKDVSPGVQPTQPQGVASSRGHPSQQSQYSHSRPPQQQQQQQHTSSPSEASQPPPPSLGVQSSHR